MKVLKLSAQGLPQSWISLEQAVLHYAADEVRWQLRHASPVIRDILRKLPSPARGGGTLGALIRDLHAELATGG